MTAIQELIVKLKNHSAQEKNPHFYSIWHLAVSEAELMLQKEQQQMADEFMKGEESGFEQAINQIGKK